MKFKLTNFFQIEWLGYSLKPVYSDLQFLSTPLVFFYWKNLLLTFHTILMKLETIIKRNKKKQLENPFRKSSISQLCTKYWSRPTFLINISFHKIIQIVRALWLAIKPFCMSVCKHGFRSSFISYFIKEM